MAQQVEHDRGDQFPNDMIISRALARHLDEAPDAAAAHAAILDAVALLELQLISARGKLGLL